MILAERGSEVDMGEKGRSNERNGRGEYYEEDGAEVCGIVNRTSAQFLVDITHHVLIPHF